MSEYHKDTHDLHKERREREREEEEEEEGKFCMRLVHNEEFAGKLTSKQDCLIFVNLHPQLTVPLRNLVVEGGENKKSSKELL